ncbi:MAG: TIM barrel protein [Acidaminobacteraceae bacterium]
MKKFITFDEKILSNISLNEYINYLHTRRVDGLEVALHDKLLDFSDYIDLAKKISKSSMTLNYHIPDFVTHGEYEIADIRTNSSIKENFIKYYDNILRLMEHGKLRSETTIIFHGAKAYDNDYKKAYDNTMFFSDFSLNLFEKRDLPFSLSCESLNSNIMTFGDKRFDLVKLVSQFESDSLGICWDLIHDTNNFYDNYTMPDELFYKHINNVHIHGSRKVLTTIEDHLPLYRSEINLETYIDYLKQHDYSGALTHELLSFRCSNYKLDLDKDLDLLDEFFTN